MAFPSISELIAYDSGTETQNIDKAIAITQRSIKHRETLVSFLEADVNKAIKMLRYIATDDEIDKMMKLKSEDLKREKLISHTYFHYGIGM